MRPSTGHPARGPEQLLVTVEVLGAGLTALALVGLTVIAPVAVLAALVTGILNTTAGGGAVVTFLALTAIGVPPLTAHATSQAATPASFLAASGLTRHHWPGWPMLAWGCAGTVIGVAILAGTPPRTFAQVAPAVLVPAAVLVLMQDIVTRRIQRAGHTLSPTATHLCMALCGIYAGLIGVGTGTLALLVLGLTTTGALRDVLHRRNITLLGMALLVAAMIATTGLVDWTLAATLALPGAIGGWIGTILVGRLPAPVLRATIAATAVAGAAWMTWR